MGSQINQLKPENGMVKYIAFIQSFKDSSSPNDC